MGAANKRINTANFDSGIDFRKFFVESDGVCYPRESVNVGDNTNHCLDHYRHLKLFYKVYVAEPLLNPCISYAVEKDWYRIQFLELRFQVDHINPGKIQLSEVYRVDPAKARLLFIRFSYKKSEMVS